MKYLLVLAVVLIGVHLWRQQRQDALRNRPDRKPNTPPNAPVPMVTCRHCGLHLPASEAVQGKLGYYCGTEHQRCAEG